MDILHVSKVTDIAAAKTGIVFLYYSIEVRDRLLSVLHNAGHTWTSDTPLTDDLQRGCMGTPGGLRISSRGALRGDIEFYTDTLPHLTQYRVVL